MEEKYLFSKFQVQDIHKLIPLYKNSFNADVSASEINEKYFSAYQKFQLSGAYKYNQTEIICFYGLIYQKAVFQQKIYNLLQSCDSMTHTEHSGQGLFVSLANKVYSDIENNPIDLIFGFPNTTIYNLRIKKLFWEHIDNVNFYCEKVRTFPLSKIVKKFRSLKGFYIAYLHIALRKFKSSARFFENSSIDHTHGGIIHDEDYFSYKKGENKFILHINGINFWVKFDGMLWVGDFERTEKDKFDKAFKTLRKIAFFSGCNKVAFHYQENSHNDVILKKSFQIKDKLPLGLRRFKTADHLPDLKLCAADFDTW